MRLSKSWIIAVKDFSTFRRKKNIIYSTLGVPILVSLLIPTVLRIAEARKPVTLALAVPHLLPAFAFFFLFLAGVTPTTIASYTIVGEKVERSLEPLLATPTTDGEILVGKGIAAFVPPYIAILLGSVIFMVLADAVTHVALGYNYFPNGNASLVLFLLVPLGAVMSVAWNVIVSSRVSDVRVAQQIGMLFALPLVGIYVAGELNLIALGDSGVLLRIAGALALADVILMYLAIATFRRDEILTRWR